MRHTVTLSRPADATSDIFLLVAWHKQIGEAVQEGDTIATVRASDTGAEFAVASPAFGVLAKKSVLPGEAVEVGEPIAILAGVPDTFLTPTPAVPQAFSARPPYIPAGPEDIVPVSPVAQAIADHMARSVQFSPHVYSVAPVPLGEVMRLSDKTGTTPFPFVVSAVAAALTQFPPLNAERVGNEQIRRKKYVHIGVAQRTAENRLMVLVLRDADKKSVMALARELANFSARAETGTLRPDEQRGATFTITQAATDAAAWWQTPILHQPQAAMLSVGPVVRVPVAAGGDGDAVCVRPVVHLCLAHDARIVQNETAQAFLAEVKRNLENARFLFAGV